MKDNYNIEIIRNNILWKLLERCSSLMVSLIVAVVLTRIVEPSDYGLVAIVSVFVNFLQIVVSSGLSNALIQKKGTDEIDYSTLFWFNLVISIVLYIIVFIISPIVANFYKYKELSNLLRVLSVNILIVSYNSIQNAYISNNMLFKKYFFSTISSKLISGIIGILMAINNYGAWSLVIQMVTQKIIECITINRIIDWKPKLLFSFERAEMLYKFSIRITLMSLIESIGDQIKSLVIGKAYNAETLAYYEKGTTLPSTIATNSLSAISAVMFPVLSNSSNNEKLLESTRAWISLLSYIALPMFAGLFLIAKPFVIAVYGIKWLFASDFLKFGCLTYMSLIIEVPIREAIKSKGNSKACLRMQIIKTLLIVFVVLFVSKYDIKYLICCLVIYSVISVLISIHYSSKILNYSILMIFKDICINLLSSFIMIVFVLPIKFIIRNIYIQLLLQVIVGILVYIMASFIFKNNNMFTLIKIMKIK